MLEMTWMHDLLSSKSSYLYDLASFINLLCLYDLGILFLVTFTGLLLFILRFLRCFRLCLLSFFSSCSFSFGMVFILIWLLWFGYLPFICMVRMVCLLCYVTSFLWSAISAAYVFQWIHGLQKFPGLRTCHAYWKSRCRVLGVIPVTRVDPIKVSIVTGVC